jgi:hypothetical protein
MPITAVRYSCQVLFPIVSVVPVPRLFGCRPHRCIPHPPDPPRLCCPRSCPPSCRRPLAFCVVLSAFPVLRGGAVSGQVARLRAFCVLTSQAPRYLGLLAHPWGLLTANDPLTSHLDGEEVVCVFGVVDSSRKPKTEKRLVLETESENTQFTLCPAALGPSTHCVNGCRRPNMLVDVAMFRQCCGHASCHLRSRHGLGKHTKTFSPRSQKINEKSSVRTRFSKVQRFSTLLEPRTGLVVRFYPSTRTLDRTSVRF